MEPRFTWLHVSDVHVGQGDGAVRWDQRLVLQKLLHDAQTHCTREGLTPEAILVTGDLAFSGDSRDPQSSAAESEYRQVGNWLRDLGEAVGVSRRAIFVVPGNHDVQRERSRQDRDTWRMLAALRGGEETLDDALQAPTDRERLEARFANYLSFARDFAPACLASEPRAQLFWQHAFSARSGQRVRLVGLNTALLSQDDEDRGRLRLGKRQLAEAVLAPRGRDELVLVLTHHPFAWLADGAEAEGWVRGHAHVHLCGHVHEAEAEAWRTGGGQELLRVVAGAAHADPTEPTGHGYGVAGVWGTPGGAHELRVYPRSWSVPTTSFRLDAAGVPDGQRCSRLALRLEG